MAFAIGAACLVLEQVGLAADAPPEADSARRRAEISPRRQFQLRGQEVHETLYARGHVARRGVDHLHAICG